MRFLQMALYFLRLREQEILYAVVEICIFRNTEASREIPTKLACFST